MKAFYRRRDRRAAAVWVIAVALAVVGGLNTLYIGAVFGTLPDYSKLFASAVASKALAELLANGREIAGVLGLFRRRQ